MASHGRITLEDVAAEAGVSRGSVSNVIRNQPHIRDSVRKRVLDAIDKLGYRPSASARSLVSGRTGVIALAIPNFAQPYFADLASRAVAEAEKHGLRLVVQQTDNRLERERDVANAWNLGTADGLVFSPSSITDDEIETLHAGMPLVLLGERSKLESVDRVGIDSVAVARTATEHLITRGRTRIAMIGEKTFGDQNVVSEREHGYHLALEAAGLGVPFDIGHVEDWTRADGERAMDAMLKHGTFFDAVFCANDLLALGAMRSLRAHGRSIPRDVAVVGVDDIEDARFAEPPLTTVSIDRAWMIEAAFTQLLRRLDRPHEPAQQVTTPFRLVVRNSSLR